MAREHFQNLLRGLEKELVDMGEMVIAAIQRSDRWLEERRQGAKPSASSPTTP